MTVHLVGAGPGDPGLLTVRGAELLAGADVVVHDRLSAPGLLRLVPSHTRICPVGKDPNGHSVTQAEVNALLVELGSQGLEVVRLIDGDPFLFAQGADEAHALAAAGIDYEVVPGISSAIAAPAYAGIPVTRRHSSSSVTIVTGHEDPAETTSGVDWEALAKVGGTIVVLMAVSNISMISRRLLAAGLPGSTPVTAVRRGTRPDQSVVRSTLAQIADEPLRSPSTIVIGDVAAEELDWFTRRELHGRTIAVTRSSEQSGHFAGMLRGAGAEVVEVPAIRIEEPADGGEALRCAVEGVRGYEWVILTSPNGARRFCAQLRDGRDLAGVSIAAIGPGTAGCLDQFNLVADLVPERFVAEGLLEVFPGPSGGRRILMPRAEVAREVLPEGLRSMGWHVDVVEAYRTLPAELSDLDRDRLADCGIVTFASASSVTSLVATAGASAIPSTVATIGPITAAAARDAGLEVEIEAPVHTLDGLLDAVLSWCAAEHAK